VSTLFRPEAIEGQRQSWLGEVRLVRPLPLTVLTVWAVGLALLLVGFMFLGEYTRKTGLVGSLEAADPGASGRLQAVLCAGPSTVGLLRPDQPVLLRYEALGRQHDDAPPSGRIASVARTPAAGCASDAMAGEIGTAPVARYRVTVTLDAPTAQAAGRAPALTAGMRVDAVVLLERRRIVDWLFEPGAPGSSG
jgi:hypothetical protein